MFEDSLVESRVPHLSSTKRWTMLGSTALQAAIAATLITIPLLHPEHLVFHADTPLVFTPPPPRPPVQVTQPQRTSEGASSLTIVPVAPNLPPMIHAAGPATDVPPVTGPINLTMGSGDEIPGTLTSSTGHGTGVTVASTPPPAKPLKVSEGVTAGMLLAPIRPVYPAIAKAAGISGTVIVEAIISKTGTIESLKVVSGPEMLRQSALDAIRAARYRPYLLNSEPTEIQTTFTVRFTLGG